MKRRIEMKIDTFLPGGELYQPARHSALMRRMGPFLFLMGVEGADPATGRVAATLEDLPREIRLELGSGDIHRDNVEGPIMAQSWLMFENLRRFLEAAGTSIDNLLHTIVFLRNIRENWVVFDRVRRMMVKNPPPSTAIEMSRLCTSDEVLVAIHAIAGIEDTENSIETIRLPRNGELATRRLYGAGVKRLGPLVFAMGTGGVDPATRKIIRGLDDLTDEARRELGSGEMPGTTFGEAMMAQTWVGYQNVRRYLESAGSSLENLLHENVFIRNIKQNWAAFDAVRRRVMKDPPPITAVETPRLGISDDLLVEIHAIGGVTDENTPPQTVPSDGERLTAVPGAVLKRAGSLLFIGGMTGVDLATGKLSRNLGDLPMEVRKQVSSGDVYRDRLEGPMLAQAWTAYHNLHQLLKSAGSSLEHMLDAIVFIRDVKEDWIPFDRVSRLMVKDPPASTVVEAPHPGVLDELFSINVIAGIPDGK